MSATAPEESLPNGLSDEALLAGMAADAVGCRDGVVRRHQPGCSGGTSPGVRPGLGADR
jgi:hypothetical protein